MLAVQTFPDTQTVTVGGTTAGVITVTSTAKFVRNAVVFVNANAVTGKRMKVVSVNSATELRLRGYDDRDDWDLSAFTVVANATVSMPAQRVHDLLPQDIPDAYAQNVV